MNWKDAGISQGQCEVALREDQHRYNTMVRREVIKRWSNYEEWDCQIAMVGVPKMRQRDAVRKNAVASGLLVMTSDAYGTEER